MSTGKTSGRVAIIGGGAMGSLMAGRMSSAGISVVVMDTWLEHVEAISREGLRVESDNGPELHRIDATSDLRAVSDADFIILLVKAYRSADALAAAVPFLKPDSVVASFQNGLGNEDIIANAVGADRTLAGSLYFGGNVVKPGVVRYSGQPEAALGALTPAGHPAAVVLQGLLQRAGFGASLSEDILAIKWQKALLNVGNSAIGTIVGKPIRAAAEQPGIRAAMEASCAEGIEVAKRLGVKLPEEKEPASYVGAGIDHHSYEHKVSMLLDVEAGMPTEIEFMNGAIVRYAERLGMKVPINVVLTAAIRRIEALSAAGRGRK
jgi:2-dehydropantoate 2-reductase